MKENSWWNKFRYLTKGGPYLPGILTDEEVKQKYPSYIKFDGNRVIITSHGYTNQMTRKEFYNRYKEDMIGLKEDCPDIFEVYRIVLSYRSIHDTMGEFQFYQKWLYKYLFGDKV